MTALRQLVGVAPGDVERLAQAGIDSLSALAEADLETLCRQTQIPSATLVSYQQLCVAEIGARRRGWVLTSGSAVLVVVAALGLSGWALGQMRFGAAVSALEEGRLEDAQRLARQARSSSAPGVPTSELLNLEGAATYRQALAKPPEERAQELRAARELFARATTADPSNRGARRNTRLADTQIDRLNGTDIAPAPLPPAELDAGAQAPAEPEDAEATAPDPLASCDEPELSGLVTAYAVRVSQRARRALERAGAAGSDLRHDLERRSIRSERTRTPDVSTAPSAGDEAVARAETCRRQLGERFASAAIPAALIADLESLESAAEQGLAQVAELRRTARASLAEAPAAAETPAVADAPPPVQIQVSSYGSVQATPSLIDRDAVERRIAARYRRAGCTLAARAVSVLVFVSEGSVQLGADSSRALGDGQDRSPVPLHVESARERRCYRDLVEPLLPGLRFEPSTGVSAWVELRVRFENG